LDVWFLRYASGETDRHKHTDCSSFHPYEGQSNVVTLQYCAQKSELNNLYCIPSLLFSFEMWFINLSDCHKVHFILNNALG